MTTMNLVVGALMAVSLPWSEAPAGTDAAAHAARAPVRVVATLPVYASLAEAVGGAEVEATWIADPNEDAHFVRPKPSFALDLRRADLFITTGLDLELWVPALLDKAGNPDVLEGGRGYVSAHTGITLLDIPTAADRSQGDVHIFGNPHLHTDPLRALQVARNITRGLENVAPDRAAVFDAGLARLQSEIWERLFGAELVEMLGGETLEQLALNGGLMDFLASNQFEGAPLTDHLGGWLAAAAPLRGKQILCYHKNWAYFEDRFGITCAAYVESKPGIPATPRHVADLVARMRNGELPVLLASSYFDPKKVQSVASRGGARPVVVPTQTHARAGLEGYPALVDLWINQLAAALEAS